MPNSNSEIAWRHGGGIQYSEDMPEWLRRQFEWRVDSEGPSQGYWVAPDLIRDEDGNELVLADDRGDLITNGEYALNEGASARWIPGIGYAANVTDAHSTGKYESRARRNQLVAAAIIGGSAIAGATIAGGTVGAGAGAGGAGTGTGSGLGITATGELGAGLGTSGTAAGTTTAAGTAGITATGSLGAGAGATGTGTVGTGGFLGGVSSWYNGLSPASRLILGTAVSQGANALAQSVAQREQQEFIDDQREQQEEDRRRRGYIPSFGSAFTPKPGIIASRRGG